ncbi:MAG: tRNA epoxyqueuosine(34) reductase QueG [Acidobacteria bacterium]|nr:tRNA epoxyqueuosine(34) reductase QueG [Acidobacteriota bacterium]
MPAENSCHDAKLGRAGNTRKHRKGRRLVVNFNLKSWLRGAAVRLGFDLCGIAPAGLDPKNRDQYLWWLAQGFHGEMGYMKRFERQDVRALMPSLRSVICVAMNYNSANPLSTECNDSTRGWIARYAWGDDYHEVMRERLEMLVEELRAAVGEELEAKIYVDTGPLLERAIAWAAGLGWIAKNTCLINEGIGSWFFLGEILTNLELEPDLPSPDRCGTCTKCIDACPTAAITEPYVLDATRCISYYTIEVKGAIPEPLRSQMGRHVFGCDICQDVCPWNREAASTSLPEYQPRQLQPAPDAPASVFNPPLEILAELDEEQFNQMFRGSPVLRPKYRGFLRNVVVAMANSQDVKFRPVLERLAGHPDPLISEHARWALNQLR